MAIAPNPRDFLAGIIEGFYGEPWSVAERLDLFRRMSALGLNTYLYAPKDDLKHRTLWRQCYTKAESARLRTLIRECQRKGVRFVYALAPGLNIKYSKAAELKTIQARFTQLLTLGCRDFALLFDDIPDRLDERDLKKWGSLASAQCHVTNQTLNWLVRRNVRGKFLFCPTPYCGRMAARDLGGEGYLETVGEKLATRIHVFWTGPEIISQKISVAHVRKVAKALRRKPLIWDNIHANDYDSRRFFSGPYSGRPLELRNEVSGILSNPNCEYVLNEIPIRTLAEFVKAKKKWSPRQAYLNAIARWLPRFQPASKRFSLDDLVFFCDCFYLPYEDGPKAEKLLNGIRAALKETNRQSKSLAQHCQNELVRLREICARMNDLKDRSLFYALSRKVWELREELDLLNGFISFQRKAKTGNGECQSDFHLPGTFRGGIIARLQSLLMLRDDGIFVSGVGQNGTSDEHRTRLKQQRILNS